MADQNHLVILRKGVEVWNQWRKDNSYIRPDLSRVNLSRVNLESANLRNANLESADFLGADFLGADLRDAILEGAILEGAILEGAILEGAILEGAILEGAILEGANLSSANLTDANLTQVQALETNFEGATLTGACIEDWNINSKTNLQNVNCDYIYLKYSYSQEEKKLIYGDRRPHDPDKIFAPGEFEQLFKKALETVDLIFADGVDWQAFLVSFNKLQIECDSDELSINSFENKGNGAFVIRVNVPDGADKAEIEKYLKKQYQLEATVEAQQRELTNLYEVTKLLAGKATTEIRNTHIEKGNYNENIQGNNYEQKGNFGVGNNQGEISGDAEVTGQS